MLVACRLIVGLALGASLACHTAPSAVLREFRIDPSIATVKIGASVQLTASAMVLGNRQIVPVSWSTSDPAVASIDAAGLLTGRGNGHTEVMAAAQGASTNLSVRVLPDYDGKWQIVSLIKQCDRVSGEGTNTCRFDVGITQKDLYALRQNDARVTGTFVRPGLSGLDGQIDGTIDERGVLSFGGSFVFPPGNASGVITDGQLGRASANGATLDGSAKQESRFTNPFGPQVLLYTLQLTGQRVE